MTKNIQQTEPWRLREKRTREKGIIPWRKIYLICTEGKTEANYFSNYKSSTGPVVIPLDKSDSKKSLVKKTIEEKKNKILKGEFNEKLDEAWVVLDRDANLQNKQDKTHFIQALELAKKNNINVAYSNDSFELWFLLHFQDLWAAKYRDQLCKMLTMHRGKKYAKPDNIYSEIKHLRSIAIERAIKLLTSGAKPEDANPSTAVHLLVGKLLKEPGYREKD